MILQEHSWRQTTPTQALGHTKPLDEESRCVLDRLAAMAPSFRDNCINAKPLRIPLFVTQVIYQIACLNIEAEQSGLSDVVLEGRLEVIMDVLQLLRKTWRLAGKSKIIATKAAMLMGKTSYLFKSTTIETSFGGNRSIWTDWLGPTSIC